MKRLLAIMLMLLVCLTGCSSGARSFGPEDDVTVTWTDGVLYFGKDASMASEYKGFSAIYGPDTTGCVFNLAIDSAKDVTNITVNTQGILEENMDKHKDAFYYQEYLGSNFTMAKSIGNDTWSVATTNPKGMAVTLVATQAYNAIDTIPLTNKQVYCDFGKFVVGTAYDLLTVNKEGCSIDGLVKVVKKDYTGKEPFTLTVGESTISMTKASTEKWDYYAYDGFLIQVAKGLDVTQYVKFKEVK